MFCPFDQPKSSSNANETRAKIEEKTESPNNTNVAMVMFDNTPKSSNKANFTRARLDVKTESPRDANVTSARFDDRWLWQVVVWLWLCGCGRWL